MAKVTWHEKVLDRSGLESIERLTSVLGHSFYLAGGTALALQFGHRVSLDLDFFSATEKLRTPQRQQMIESLKQSGPIKIAEQSDGTIHCLLENTSVSIFYYPVQLLQKKMRLWRSLSIASIEDIAAMKLSAILGRGTKKDFIDVYVLAQEHGLEALFEWGARKFPESSDFLLQSARALVYFNDAEKDPMPKMLKPIEWKTVKAYFSVEIPRAAKRGIRRG